MPRTTRPIRAPDFSELETLLECAAEGSLTAAAAKLGISRPAVAKRLRNLETLAGAPLFHRGGRGVRLTDAGAKLLAGARRALEDRQALLGTLAELRQEDSTSISGLKAILGEPDPMAVAHGSAESRLAETERFLELVLRTSSTGVAVSDSATGVFHVVNQAFCDTVGRAPEELIGRPSVELGIWADPGDRAPLIEELQRTGKLERARVRVRRPDGGLRIVETTAYFMHLAGTRQMFSTLDDVTGAFWAESERDASVAASRALHGIYRRLAAGQTPLEGVGAALGELRSAGDFDTTLIWDHEASRAAALEGDAPDGTLTERLAQEGAGERGVNVLKPTAGRGEALRVPFTDKRHSLVLAWMQERPESFVTVFEDALNDLATLATATRN